MGGACSCSSEATLSLPVCGPVPLMGLNTSVDLWGRGLIPVSKLVSKEQQEAREKEHGDLDDLDSVHEMCSTNHETSESSVKLLGHLYFPREANNHCAPGDSKDLNGY